MNEETKKYIDEKVEEFKKNLIKQIECKQERENEFPKIGDDYWFLTDNGAIECDIWEDSIIDRYRLEIGNVSPTEEEMEFTYERLKVIKELEKHAEPKDSAWDGERHHYYILYDYSMRKIDYSSLSILKGTGIYFESEERAREAVKKVGVERVKKYYLRVEE